MYISATRNAEQENQRAYGTISDMFMVTSTVIFCKPLKFLLPRAHARYCFNKKAMGLMAQLSVGLSLN